MPPPPETLVLAAGRLRHRGRLDAPASLPVEDPPLAAVAACLGPGPSWLGGGEPTLRADLPALVQACAGPGLGLCTDGLALDDEALARRLRAWGLRRVRIPFHAARADAHDWLVDLPGAGRRASRALRACAATGLEVQVEVVLTRPTVDLLPETVAAAARLGATVIHLRRLRAHGAAADPFVSLSPRLGLAEPLIERAARAAWTAGVDLWLHGLPACAVGTARDRLAPPVAVVAPTPALAAVAAELAPAFAPGCVTCPGLPTCGGAPADYVARLGRAEIDDRCSRPAGVGLDLPSGEGPPGTPPPPRAGRAPATRIAFALRQAARGPLAGDPLAGVPGVDLPPVLITAFPPGVSTRPLRQELCRLSQVGSPVLRIDDAHSLRHPEIGALLRECVRLGFQRVELAGPVQGLSGLLDRDLVALKGLSRVEAWVRGEDEAAHDALAGEGDWAVIEAVLERLARLSGAAVGRRVVG